MRICLPKGHAARKRDREMTVTTRFFCPATDPVRPLPVGRANEWDGPTSASAPRGGTTFHSLREYEAGDDLRMIHWPSTARVGSPMVCESIT